MTLLELLTVLAIVSMMLAVVTLALPRALAGPGPEALVGAARLDLAHARLTAMRSGQPVSTTGTGRAGDGCYQVVFLPDGSAYGGPVCLRSGDETIRLAIRGATGMAEVTE